MKGAFSVYNDENTMESRVLITETGIEVLKDALGAAVAIYEDDIEEAYDDKSEEDIEWCRQAVYVLNQLLSAMN